MADAVISVVLERVAAILEEKISYEVNLLRGVEKKVRDVSDTLRMIRDVLDDAEKRGVKEQSVKRWLKKLEDTAYEMEDILDEWNYTLLKHKMEDSAVDSAEQKVCCSLIPSSSLYFQKLADRRETAKKIQNVKASLDRILKEKDDFKFVVSQPTTEPLRPQTTSLIDVEKVHGVDIDRNKNDIVRKLLMDNNGDSQIVCVVGMGGLGKTTLAQLVYNDTQVKGCFDLTIWICVSDPFDEAGIARGIIEKVTNQIIPHANQLDWVLGKLRECISGKKFFLVLDDVWTEDYKKWEPLKMSLDDGAQGSKILVTTRKDGVAKMMSRGNVDVEIYRPRKLSDEECWTMLRRISLSGRSEEECREFEDVGKKIAGKCEGLPLAAIVLGGLLESKKSLEEWENVLESEIWQLEEAEKDLFPHLLLSYNELSPALKRCFSYCAVYPKDYRINVERLKEAWVALGYLGCVAGKSGVEVKMRDYFNNLARRSLFQDFERSSESGEIEWCKMHDIVHDFAQFLRNNIQNDRVEAPGMTKRSCGVCNPLLLSQVQEYRSLDWGRESPTSICNCVTSVRVLRVYWGTCLPRGMEKLIHLRWLELSGNKLSGEDLNIICRLYFLQTLLLAGCSIKEIPSEIGNLVELRHLHLSKNTELKELPESMCSLVELRILNIEDCWNLSTLPEEIHRLKNLQHLLIGNTLMINPFPQGVGELSGLRTLSIDTFSAGISAGWNKLGLLKKLNRLTGSLALKIWIGCIGDLRELVEDAREAELRNKVHLHSLNLLFLSGMDETERSSSSSLWMDVIEALEPHHKLEKLQIKGYVGSRLPHWILSPLNLIKQIHLRDLSEVSSLPPMGKLPFLEVLTIRKLNKLKLVGREFMGIECCSSSSSTSNDVDVVAFPKLKKLEFHSCNNWEEWSDITAEEEESADVSIMPCLTELKISWCWHLKKLPHRLLRKTSSSLQILNIISSSELLKSYQDRDGSPWRSQFNPHLQLLQEPIIF